MSMKNKEGIIWVDRYVVTDTTMKDVEVDG